MLTSSVVSGVPKELQQEFLKDIDMEIDRLNSIISDLLQLVNTNNTKSALKLESVNIAELINATIEKLIPIADKKNVKITFNADNEIITKVDKIKLQMCFSNLIDNAIKYGQTDGNVTINCYTQKNDFIVSVKDDGIGIPENDLPHIFDRFYRVDKTRSRATGGTGLGLSITQRVIHMHDGTIIAKSTLGEGTEFVVTIPIVE